MPGAEDNSSVPESAAASRGRVPTWMDRLQVILLFTILIFHSTDFAFDLHHPQGSDTTRHVISFLRTGPPDSGKHVYVTLADLLVAAGFGLYLLRWALRREWRRLPRVPLPTILLCVWFLLSGVSFLKGGFARYASLDKMGFFKEFVQLFEYLVAAYLLFEEGFRDRERRRAAVAIARALATVLVAWAGWQYLNPKVGALLVSGPLATRNSLGSTLAMMLPFTLGVGLFSGSKALVVWCAALLVAGSLVTLSGGALIAMTLGALVVAFLRSRTAFVAVAVAAALVVGVVLPGASRILPRDNMGILVDSLLLFRRNDPYRTLKWSRSQPADAKIEDIEGEDDGRYWRQKFKEWQVALLLASRSPLFGVGGGSFVKSARGAGYYNNDLNEFSMSKPSVDLMEPEAQSFYLTLAATLGLPAVFFWLWLLLDHGAAAGRAMGSPDDMDRGVAAGALGAFVGVGMVSFFTEPLVRGCGLTLPILLALAVCAGRAVDRTTE